MVGLETVLISLIGAMGISFTQYVAKMKSGQRFDLKKFGRTMAAGLGAGVVAWVSGNEPSLAEPTSIAATGGMIGAFDVVSKFVWRLFSKKE